MLKKKYGRCTFMNAQPPLLSHPTKTKFIMLDLVLLPRRTSDKKLGQSTMEFPMESFFFTAEVPGKRSNKAIIFVLYRLSHQALVIRKQGSEIGE